MYNLARWMDGYVCDHLEHASLHPALGRVLVESCEQLHRSRRLRLTRRGLWQMESVRIAFSVGLIELSVH